MTHSIKRMLGFIRRHHVLTLATESGGQPWCANMFYAWMDDGACFVFTSGPDTRHAAEWSANGRVAASIVLESKVVGRLQGLQVEGTIHRADGPVARRAYVSRFPFAAVADLDLWILRPAMMKFTDNTLGFGNKYIWRADGES